MPIHCTAGATSAPWRSSHDILRPGTKDDFCSWKEKKEKVLDGKRFFFLARRSSGRSGVITISLLPAMTVNSVNGAPAVGKVGRQQPVRINRVCLRAAPWPPPAGHQSVLRRPLAAQSPFYGACEMIKHLLMTATHIWTDRTFNARNPGGIVVMLPPRVACNKRIGIFVSDMAAGTGEARG